jgi:uncharacterized protein (DUF934 family)
MAIKIYSRSKKAGNVQDLLTEFGCFIRTRVGFHEVAEDYCSNDGIIILQLCPDEVKVKELYEKLNSLEFVAAKFIEFEK